MQGAVHPKATAVWEVTQKFEESEGHAWVCGLFVTCEDALAKPNHRAPWSDAQGFV